MTFTPKSTVAFADIAFARDTAYDDVFTEETRAAGFRLAYEAFPEELESGATFSFDKAQGTPVTIGSVLSYDEADDADTLRFELGNSAVPQGVTLGLASDPVGRVAIDRTPVDKPGVVASVDVDAADLVGRTALSLTVDLGGLALLDGASLWMTVRALRPGREPEDVQLGKVIWLLRKD